VAHVSLASEDNYHLKEIFSYMKKTIGDDTDLDSLGKILIQMGEPAQASKCYKRMLDEGKLVVANAESGLGMAYLDCNMGSESLEHLEEALRIRQLVLGEHHADIGECYSCIGRVHWLARGDYDQALSNLKKAVQIQEKTLSSYSLDLAKTYHNLATTYDLMEKYDLGLDYYRKALKIRQKVLPNNHPDIASTYNNLGKLYECKQEYPKAYEYYQRALEIKMKTLPPGHQDLIMTETNIRSLKDKMKK
jgi:tetratricopeptide (TPR) repeat protein